MSEVVTSSTNLELCVLQCRPELKVWVTGLVIEMFTNSCIPLALQGMTKNALTNVHQTSQPLSFR